MYPTKGDYIFRFITLGDSSVGKPCLVYQYIHQTFNNHHAPTIRPDFGHKVTTANGQKIKLHIWDTAGKKLARSLTKIYYRNTTEVLLFYDITCRKSFVHVASWLRDLHEHTSHFPITMPVGNKSDMVSHQEVSTEEGAEFAGVHGLMSMECSAKTGKNMEDAFRRMAEAAYESIRCVELEPDNVEDLKLQGVSYRFRWRFKYHLLFLNRH